MFEWPITGCVWRSLDPATVLWLGGPLRVVWCAPRTLSLPLHGSVIECYRSSWHAIEVDSSQLLIAEYPLLIKGLFAVAGHESPQMRKLAPAQSLHQPRMEAGAPDPEEVYEKSANPSCC